jgi:hypothetical protein
MGDNTISNKGEKGSSGTYWRRRFIALVVGLAIFGVLAWAVSGALGQPKAISPAANEVQQTASPGAGGNGTGPGSGASAQPAPPPSATSPSALPSPSPSSTGTGAKKPAPKKPAPRPPSPSPKPTGQAGGNPARAPRCYTGRVVISLVSAKTSYGPHTDPQFKMNVVSTGKHTCIFDVGAAHLALSIRSVAGQVWSSADCAQGRKSLMTNLAPGVPTTVPVTWDRTSSSPGCNAGSVKVPAGMYAATAVAGPVSSTKLIFRIR